MNDHGEAKQHRRNLKIGSIIFDDMDQIDFTGPYEVLASLSERHLHHIRRCHHNPSVIGVG